MKVRLFDCVHEKDLEDEMNDFLESMPTLRLINILYQTQIVEISEEETLYSFSAMIVYDL